MLWSELTPESIAEEKGKELEKLTGLKLRYARAECCH